jgi:hypothetical protein
MSPNDNAAGEATVAAAQHRRARRMDEATRAGLGAALCSVLILAIVLLAMHAVPPGV